MKTSKRVFEHDYDHRHPDALALYCSDGRFTRGVENMLGHLGYDRLDTMTMPGGPALLDEGSAAPAEVELCRRALAFLVEAHDIREVLFVAHQGCGYYRRRYPDASAEEIHGRQLADLRAAKRWAEKLLGVNDVDVFYAHAEGKRVVFSEIDPD